MNTTKSPFCKVCFDSGKSDTKHHVKDRKGVVCCPTLLRLKCRLCDQYGHTIKYCTKPQPKNPIANHKPTVIYKNVTKQNPIVNNSDMNKFDMLFNYGSSDEDDECDNTDIKIVDTPKVTRPPVKRWIDYDSDSDDEEIALPMPILKRYIISDKSDDSLIEYSR